MSIIIFYPVFSKLYNLNSLKNRLNVVSKHFLFDNSSISYPYKVLILYDFFHDLAII
jgi:hypothetical protein